MAIRVLVADDQAMIRGALAGLLDLESDIEVVAQACDGTHALEELARLASADDPACTSTPVDVAIIDIEMPHMDGITATQECAPWPRVAAPLTNPWPWRLCRPDLRP